MLKSYLSIAIRNLRRMKVSSIINISGLAIGLATSFLILLYVLNELSYDEFHKDADQIHRIIVDTKLFGFSASTPMSVAPVLLNGYPEVKQVTRVVKHENPIIIRRGNDLFKQSNFLFADDNLFSFFTFHLTKGDPGTALKDPFSVVLSREIADKFFVTQDPIGKTLSIKEGAEFYDLKVTGILEDLPSNSHLSAELIASISTQTKVASRQNPVAPSKGLSCMTYVLLQKGASPSGLEKKLHDFPEKHKADDEFQISSYHLQSLKDIHLDSRTENKDNIRNIYIFSAIAILILLISVFNFVILATAQYSTRTKEVGIKKVLGANRAKIVTQILGESVFATLIALPIAIAIAELLLPTVNQLLEKELTIDYLRNWQYTLAVVCLTLVVAVLSGSYISFYLSGLRPIEIFQNKLKTTDSKQSVRNILIVAQVTIFVALIASSLLINRQLQFLQWKNLGFDKEQLLTVKLPAQKQKTYAALKSAFESISGVIHVTGASYAPPSERKSYHGFVEMDENGVVTKFDKIEVVNIDYGFTETLGIDLLYGRSFSKEFPSDLSSSCLLNEETVRWKGIDEPVGKVFDLSGRKLQIVGIVKDFHIHSLHEKILPLVLLLNPEGVREMVIRIRPENLAGTVAALTSVWKNICPDDPFEYRFIDDAMQEQYRSEMKLAKIVSYFTFIAVFVACLGLFGVALFTNERRTKEIGIRKVLGATVASVTTLLSKDFIKLVLLANLIAWPVAWWAMHKWLQNFAYRIDIEWWVFVLAGGLALAIALLTVSTQAVRAALANPVEALRYE